MHNAPGWRIATIFVAWRGDRGLVDITYASDTGALLTLSVNHRRATPPSVKANDKGDETRTEERVRFCGRYTMLST